MERQNFELTQDVLSKANIGLWAIELVDGEEPRMFADATMCRLLGIPEGLPPEQVYHAWYDNVDPRHYDAVSEAVTKMVAGSHAEVQYPWRHPELGEMFVRCGGIRNRSFTRGIRLEGCHQDVSELIHVQKQAAKAELENKFLDKVIKGLPAPLFIKTAKDSRYRLCNYSFAKIHGKTPDGIRGLSDFDLFGENFARQFVAHDRETLSSPGIHYFPCHECGVGNESRLYDKWETSIDGGDGQRYIIGALWDITEFKRAERAKSEFFAKVSHDIRTPLNAVIGYSQMLSAGVDDPSERREFLDCITFSGETLLDLINDVLDLSKLEAGKVQIATDECDFDDLVRKVLRSVTPHATSRGVALVPKIEKLPILSLDVQHIRQVLFNLVGNAVKFTDRGRVEVSASFVRENDQTGRLRFSVRDTGIGMSEDELKKAFSPFMQGRNSTRRSGTGLGLSICKQLVEAMGGTITAESRLGAGSTFTAELRNVAFHDRPSASAAPAEPGDHAFGRSASELRLLIVDDIPMNLSVLKSMLKRLGITAVTTADDGIKAMELLRQTPRDFDAVLTDMWMPRCDGNQLLAEIRGFAATATLPVYAVTADVECSGGDGSAFNGVLLKPLTLDGLRKFIVGFCK